MKNIHFIILLLSLFIFTDAHSGKRKTKKYKYKNVFQVPSEKKVRTRDWAKHMRSSLRKNLCSKGGVLKQCFKVTQGACRVEVSKHFSECAKPLRRMKKIAPHGKSGISMAMKIGQCIGTRYEQRFKGRKIAKTGC